LRHADSASHKKNIQENTLSLNDNNENSHKNIYKKSTFQPQWMEIELFKPWLREVPHNKSSFFCTFCDKSTVGNLSHIYRHAESKPYINMSKKNKTETKNIDIDMIDDSLLPFDERKKAVEIQYAALIAEKTYLIKLHKKS